MGLPFCCRCLPGVMAKPTISINCPNVLVESLPVLHNGAKNPENDLSAGRQGVDGVPAHCTVRGAQHEVIIPWLYRQAATHVHQQVAQIVIKLQGLWHQQHGCVAPHLAFAGEEASRHYRL